jgi:hypothetical protein
MKDNERTELQDIDGKVRLVKVTTTWRVSHYGQPEREFDCFWKAQDSLEGIGSGDGYEIDIHEEHKVLAEAQKDCLACGFELTAGSTDGYCAGCVENGYLGCAKTPEGGTQ